MRRIDRAGLAGAAVTILCIGPAANAVVSRDAYSVVGAVEGTHEASFLLSAAGLEFVKFGSPPAALTSLDLPLSVAELSGFTIASELDHRLAFLSFENLATGGLFSNSAPLISFSMERVEGESYTASFEALLDSGFGGLPPTLLAVTYLFERRPPIFVVPHEAYYELRSIAVWLNGVEYVAVPLRIGVQNNVPYEAPEPGTLALLGFGLAGLGLSRRRKAK
jgi:hypothetical protein